MNAAKLTILNPLSTSFEYDLKNLFYAKLEFKSQRHDRLLFLWLNQKSDLKIS